MRWYTRYFSWGANDRFDDLAWRYSQLLVRGMQKTVEETAMDSPSKIVTQAFLWTFESLDEDHELERFFSGLPGFRSSKVVEDPVPNLAEEEKERLLAALTGLLDRTFSSDLLSEAVKTRRTILCTKLVNPTYTTDAIKMDERATLSSKAIFSRVVARVQPRNDSWFILASKSLGVSEDVLRGYAAHGDSLSLAILIHVTCQQFIHFRKISWPTYKFWEVLEAASEFDVSHTSSILQHEFCALWNQIVRKAQTDGDANMAFYTLGRIRNIYLALHQGTDSAPTQFSASTPDGEDILWDPSSYPMCNVPGHHPDSIHIHDDSASPTFLPALLQDNASPLPASLAGTPHAPSSSLPAPAHVDENLVDVPLTDKTLSVSTSSYPAHQTATGDPCSPGTSSAPVVAGTTQDIEMFPRTSHLFTPEPSAVTSPPKLMTLTLLPDPAAVEHTTDNHTRLYDLDVPSSSSPTPFLDGILSTGPLLCPDSPVTGSDPPSSSPEARPTMLAPGTSGPSRPWLLSTPDLGSAAHGEGSAMAKAALGNVVSISPSDTVAIEHAADSRTPSLDVPSLPSPAHVHTTGPPLTTVFPVFGTDQAYSLPESSSMLVPGALLTSPPPPSTSAPDLGAVPEDQDGAGLRKDQYARHTSLIIHEAISRPGYSTTIAVTAISH